jgi:hypothetical protein
VKRGIQEFQDEEREREEERKGGKVNVGMKLEGKWNP